MLFLIQWDFIQIAAFCSLYYFKILLRMNNEEKIFYYHQKENYTTEISEKCNSENLYFMLLVWVCLDKGRPSLDITMAFLSLGLNCNST